MQLHTVVPDVVQKPYCDAANPLPVIPGHTWSYLVIHGHNWSYLVLFSLYRSVRDSIYLVRKFERVWAHTTSSVSLFHGSTTLNRYSRITPRYRMCARYFQRSLSTLQQYNTIQYNTIQYNIVYFQHRTKLHYNNNCYPSLGWLEL